MIPKRRPPFGAGRVIRSILDFSNRATIAQVEEVYAQAYGMPHTILLPSCRAGIRWALKVTIKPNYKVICPTYTCFAVWEAITRAGGKLCFIDTKENSFLMDETAMKQAQVGNYAVVLPETFGYTYDLVRIALQATTTPTARIVDMAMTVPTREHFERLEDSDFAIISFGAGKCMYAGWGGMAFTRDTKLATSVRKIRDQSLMRCDTSLLVRRGLKILVLNLMYNRFAYGFLKRIKDVKRIIRRRVHRRSVGSVPYLNCDMPPSKEWFFPTTYIDRNLMLYNLSQAERYIKHRKSLARRYHHNLHGISGLISPELPPYPLSHYTIRVKPDVRHLLHNYLLRAGIETSTIFTFPNSLSKSEFPNASRISSEVLNLPLNINMSLGDIDRISEFVVRGCLTYENVS